MCTREYTCAMGTRSQIRTAAENGAEITDKLKQELPQKLEQFEYLVSVAAVAIVTAAFCIVLTSIVVIDTCDKIRNP